MKIGYVRVSTKEQNTARQEDMMAELGVEKLYIDKMSGKNTERPALKEMLGWIREGDIVIVHSYDRLSRSLKDLLYIIDTIRARGASFKSVHENVDTSTPQGELMMHIFASIAQYERSIIGERQMEGIQAAKARGVTLGRPKAEVDMKAFEKEYKIWKSGAETAVLARKHLGLKNNTFYKTVQRYEKEKGICLGSHTAVQRYEKEKGTRSGSHTAQNGVTQGE